MENHEHSEHHTPERSLINKENFLPISVLVAAVLISGSILYAVNRPPSAVPAIVNNDNNPSVPSADTKALLQIEDKDVVVGDSQAPVTVIEYTDYQCPFCQRFYQQTEKSIMDNYVRTNKVRFVIRNFPLVNIHQNAQKAAEGALCAAEQGKYWAMHDLLFTKGQGDGTGLAPADLKRYAANIGLDMAKFNTCLDGGRMADKVQKDLQSGQALGVNGTPSFFVNGKTLVGAQPFSVFQTAIDAALKNQ